MMPKNILINVIFFMISVVLLAGCSPTKLQIQKQQMFDTIPGNQGANGDVSGKIDWQVWNKTALATSMKFEGGNFSNITGNFDSTGLTCGSLGWTIKWNNQQPLVKNFVQQYGVPELIRLMPETGTEYWRIIQITDNDLAIQEIDAWSKGTHTVSEPYRTELDLFWKDQRMVQIQYTHSWKNMGAWAKIQAQDFAGQMHTPVTFRHFLYFFDQAVLNGSSGVFSVAQANSVSLDEILTWVKSYNDGYGQQDFKKNYTLWQEIFDQKNPDQQILFKMAYLRAQQSRAEFKAVTMNRRGGLALGASYVNGVLFN